VDKTILVCTVITTVFGAVSLLPLFGIDLRIRGRSEMSAEVLSRSWHKRGARIWTSFGLCVLSATLSGGAFYYFFHPRIVVQVLEKPVDRIIEKTVPTECPVIKACRHHQAEPKSWANTTGGYHAKQFWRGEYTARNNGSEQSYR
jgi:hypothetical protein